jgi:hypothetical protein
MDDAAPQAAAAGILRGYALAELRWGWGGAYRIGWDPVRRWWAGRRDGKGADLTAGSADELWAAVYADYTKHPVARDYSAPFPGEPRRPGVPVGRA